MFRCLLDIGNKIIEFFKDYALVCLFLLGITFILVSSSVPSVFFDKKTIEEMVASLGQACLFGGVLKFVQFSGVIEKEIEGLLSNSRFVTLLSDEQKKRHLRVIVHALIHKKYSSISEGLCDSLVKTVISEQDYILKNYQRSFEIGWDPAHSDQEHAIIMETLSAEVVPVVPSRNIEYQPSFNFKRCEVNEASLQIEYIKLNDSAIDYEVIQRPGVPFYTVKLTIPPGQSHKLAWKMTRKIPLSKDPIISVTSKSYILGTRIEARVNHSAENDIRLDFNSIGTGEFTNEDVLSHPDLEMKKFYTGLVLPGQGYSIFIARQNKRNS